MARTEQVRCGHCLGRGKIRDEYANRTDRCPTCGGTGQVQASK